MAAAILKIIQAAITVIKDTIENDGKGIAAVVIGVISIFFALLVLIIMPVVIHERVPVTITKEQAVWYWQAAKEVTEMTQSPCDDGVYVDWQEAIAIDTVRLKQNFKKSNEKRAKELTLRFIEEVGSCTYCTGEGEEEVCTDYPVYRLKTIDEVMEELEMEEEQKKIVKEKYLAMRYDFLIGFKTETIADYDTLYTGELTWIMPGHHSISSPYGMRLHPIYGTQRMHYGIDIPAPPGTSVVAAADGMIKSVSWSDSVGWTIVIDHGEDDSGKRITTRYLHMMSAKVRAGQTVQAGETICEVGDSANMGYLSTGPHLHFEAMVDGVTVDPADFFQAR